VARATGRAEAPEGRRAAVDAVRRGERSTGNIHTS
jgi:hypothetical protein